VLPIPDAFYNQDISLLIGNFDRGTILPSSVLQDNNIVSKTNCIAEIEPEMACLDIDEFLDISVKFVKAPTTTIPDAFYNQDISLLIGNFDPGTFLPSSVLQDNNIVSKTDCIAEIEPEMACLDIDQFLDMPVKFGKAPTPKTVEGSSLFAIFRNRDRSKSSPIAPSGIYN
jgi:hypothetical protein